MKIVIALDKFKGSLTAPDACEIVRRELLGVRPDAHVVIKPMADGGDGTADALHAALGGKWITKQVTGPLPAQPCPKITSVPVGATFLSRPESEDRGKNAAPTTAQTVTARYLWLAQERRAFIEMAQASGLVLVPPSQRNPLLTTTRGTGELLADAIARGAQRIWLTVGGSATTDGGIGAATALGWQFLDATGKPVQPTGGELEKIATLRWIFA